MPLDLRLLVLFEDGVDARCVHGGPSSNHFAAARTVACAMRPLRVPAHASYVRTHDTIIPYGKRVGGTALGRLLTHTHTYTFTRCAYATATLRSPPLHPASRFPLPTTHLLRCTAPAAPRLTNQEAP